jgi:hypothetical protein
MLKNSVKFSQELFDEICERISSGESLRKICKDDKMPNLTSVWKWLNNSEELSNQYARAREQQAETFVDEILSISDEILPTGFDGKIDPSVVNQARLKIDARKWVASKLKPKRFGEASVLKIDADKDLQPILNLTLNK